MQQQKMNLTWKSLLHLLMVFSSRCVDPECEDCAAANLSIEEIRTERMGQLKRNILAQLGFVNEPPIPPQDMWPLPGDDDLPPDLLDDYQKLTQVELEDEAKCMSGDFYAKPINSFVGILSEVEEERFRRGVDSDATLEDDAILSKYTITINFHLAQKLSDISKANLVLHQEHIDINGMEVSDRYQLVEIHTIINNIRYFVEKRDVDVYSSGSQYFDITHAAKLWVTGNVSGNVEMEVAVSCDSSPDCNSEFTTSGKPLAKVSFTQDTNNASQIPRIITISRNPLEVSETHRVKRNAPVVQPVYCNTTNESLCCLHPLVINFANDLGITFISKPKDFTSNFCGGYCPEVSGTGLMTPDRFQIMRLLNTSPTRSVKPCCSGIEYQPLNILVSLFNFTSFKYETHLDLLEQVKVTKCQCG